MEGDKRTFKVFGRKVSGNELLIDLNGPYYEALWLRIEFASRDTGIYEFHGVGLDPAALQVEFREKSMSINLLSEYQREPYFCISERCLEECPAQLWVIGINARGRLDGGVAGMVARLAGESLEPSLQEGLARGDRRPGKVTITEAFELSKLGVHSLAHIITVPKPDLAHLCSGLETVLDYAHRNYSSLAMPALGCGAAGFSAQQVAGPLLEVLARYKDQIRITLCVPRQADRDAFQRAAKAQGLLG
jgi:O-acetyl-ADP-ribose deacetylase (regulator of RNase III)